MLNEMLQHLEARYPIFVAALQDEGDHIESCLAQVEHLFREAGERAQSSERITQWFLDFCDRQLHALAKRALRLLDYFEEPDVLLILESVEERLAKESSTNIASSPAVEAIDRALRLWSMERNAETISDSASATSQDVRAQVANLDETDRGALVDMIQQLVADPNITCEELRGRLVARVQPQLRQAGDCGLGKGSKK